jgi:hypothetical protein
MIFLLRIFAGALAMGGLFVGCSSSSVQGAPECDCAEPGVLFVETSTPITLHASGVCTVSNCEGTGGTSGMGSSCEAVTSTAGDCSLIAQWADGKTSTTTVTFAQSTGCCSGVYPSIMTWSPTE